MSGRGDKADGDGRGARLAEALRENLRRRKAQARSRRHPAARPSGGRKDGPADSGSAETGQDGDGEAPRE